MPPDDAMPPDETAEERLEKLPEDNQQPFAPAAPVRDDAAEPDADAQPTQDLDNTHQATDTNIDSHELYDEGVSGATEASEPNAGNAVVDYNKPDEDSAA